MLDCESLAPGQLQPGRSDGNIAFLAALAETRGFQLRLTSLRSRFPMVLQWFPSPGCPPLDPAASVSCGDGDGDGPSSNPGASWSILEMGHGSVLKKADGKPCDEAVPCWMVRLFRHAAKVETYPSVNRYIHGRRVQAHTDAFLLSSSRLCWNKDKSFSGKANHESSSKSPFLWVLENITSFPVMVVVCGSRGESRISHRTMSVLSVSCQVWQGSLGSPNLQSQQQERFFSDSAAIISHHCVASYIAYYSFIWGSK